MLQQQIHPQFFEIFGKKFIDIAIDDEQELRDQATRCAVEVESSISDVQSLIIELEAFLETSDVNVIHRLGEVSQIPWDCDEETQAALRTVVAEIIDELKASAIHDSR